MTAARLVAALRDASSYDRPNVRGPKRVHVAEFDGPSVNGCVTLLARCSGVLLDESGMYHSLDKVPTHVRCRRRGCVNRWPRP